MDIFNPVCSYFTTSAIKFEKILSNLSDPILTEIRGYFIDCSNIAHCTLFHGINHFATSDSAILIVGKSWIWIIATRIKPTLTEIIWSITFRNNLGLDHINPCEPVIKVRWLKIKFGGLNIRMLAIDNRLMLFKTISRGIVLWGGAGNLLGIFKKAVLTHYDFKFDLFIWNQLNSNYKLLVWLISIWWCKF